MQLIEIFLPLRDNEGHAFGSTMFAQVRERLIDLYGGVTVFSRAPAVGLFESGNDVQRDEIIVFEVMVPELKRAWWQAYREKLEKDFRQDKILIRATLVVTL